MTQKPITGPEDLTPLQLRYLRNIRDYCNSPPTLARIYAKTWRNLRLVLLVGVAGVAAGVLLDRPFVAWMVGGMAAGGLLRDLGYFRQTVQLWPATRAVINREKLEELLADPPNDNYS